MARLTRKNIKVFAGSATNNGIFGSLQANNPVTTNDVEQIQSLSAWEQGWNAATETSEELPPLEEIQGVSYVTTYEQAYLMQEGLPEWASTVTYYKGSLTKEVTANGFRIYCSLTDNNTNNVLTDTGNWKKVMDSEDLYAFDSAVVHNTGNENVAGVKTFSSSPEVPTATAGDSSAKAASTEFVSTADSALQTQINGKQATITGGASTIASSNLTVNRALVSNSSGKVAVSAVTATELGYLDGVTSLIQTQLDGKVGMTSGSVNRTINGNTYTQYYLRFSNGIQICSGTTETTGANNTVMNFAQSFSTVWGGNITAIITGNAGYSAYIHSLSTSGVSVHRYSNDSGTKCYYVVIGYKA